jgi:hypothetical protein
MIIFDLGVHEYQKFENCCWFSSLNTRASLSAAVSGGLSCCLVDDEATFEATFEFDVLFDRNATVAVSLHSSIADATKL